ncbi:MAG: hypothetical protein KC589_04615 [Nanoarchaeota archaeon]|nr:hypothetical protein [Nanoarchaeota archaeon]
MTTNSNIKLNINTLIELGFNKNEAKVYLSIIKFNESDANRIIKDTKFHKNIVYDNLEKLVNKGLLTYIQKDKKRIYKLENSLNLVNFFNKKKEEIELKENLAKEIAKEIEIQTSKELVKQDAKIFKGKEAVKTFYNLTLKGGDYVIFGAPKKSVEIMGELFWKTYNKKKNNFGIKVRMIFNEELRDFSKKIKDTNTTIRFFEKDFEPLTETHIQNDFVAIIVWTDEPIIFYIEDKEVAKSYGNFFEKLWKISIK